MTWLQHDIHHFHASVTFLRPVPKTVQVSNGAMQDHTQSRATGRGICTPASDCQHRTLCSSHVDVDTVPEEEEPVS
eukprot:21873_6